MGTAGFCGLPLVADNLPPAGFSLPYPFERPIFRHVHRVGSPNATISSRGDRTDRVPMIGRSFVTTLLVWTAAAAAIAAQPTAEKAPGARPEQIARVAEPGDLVVEMQAHRRSGVVSAWLVNGIRVHHRRMTVQPDQIEVMISFAGGELLECPETRGLSLLCAALLDRPSSRAIAQEDIRQRLEGRDVLIEGGAMHDSLLVRVSGAAADIRAGIEVAASALSSPLVTEDSMVIARTAACDDVKRTQNDARWSVTEPLLELVTPINECRNKLACTKRMGMYTAEQATNWVVRHAGSSPCEIAIVGDIEANEAIAMIAEVFAKFPARPRASPAALAQQRAVPKQHGPFAKNVGCKGEAKIEEAHVLAGFLSPDPSEVQEVRRLRAGARVLAKRLEVRLRELKLGGDPHVSWTYMPSPFAGRSVTVVAASVTPGDAESVKRVMQASMCELMDNGLPADELAQSTEVLARVAAAYERDPRYWAAILARSTSGGLDPEQISDGPETYRAMKPDEVLAAMRRACTIENRLDLVVRPAQ